MLEDDDSDQRSSRRRLALPLNHPAHLHGLNTHAAALGRLVAERLVRVLGGRIKQSLLLGSECLVLSQQLGILAPAGWVVAARGSKGRYEESW